MGRWSGWSSQAGPTTSPVLRGFGSLGSLGGLESEIPLSPLENAIVANHKHSHGDKSDVLYDGYSLNRSLHIFLLGSRVYLSVALLGSIWHPIRSSMPKVPWCEDGLVRSNFSIPRPLDQIGSICWGLDHADFPGQQDLDSTTLR
jgi:hypothetical protein